MVGGLTFKYPYFGGKIYPLQGTEIINAEEKRKEPLAQWYSRLIALWSLLSNSKKKTVERKGSRKKKAQKCWREKLNEQVIIYSVFQRAKQ